MAPEIALDHLRTLPPGALVLDPMAGSGTVVRLAAEAGHRAVGFDLDPLAVLMARVWTTPLDTTALRHAGAAIAAHARQSARTEPHLPWIDDDPETCAFVDYWFAPPQQDALRRLAALLAVRGDPIGDALRIGLSRIIITKDRGASLARDVSHSRPHRIRQENDFPVLDAFERSVQRLADRLDAQPPPGRVRIARGDARHLADIADGSIDAVITSPPYLNALDYLRGHRLSLVWLGYRLAELRAIRAAAIGAERAPDPPAPSPAIQSLRAALGPLDGLPARQHRMIERYLLDVRAFVREIARVLRPGGRAVLVVGSSRLRGIPVPNARAVVQAAHESGLDLLSERERPLPPDRRYLPPPREADPTDLEKRLRSETVLVFERR
ncbi:MAG: hypothetical protein IRY83_09005 [Chloroflexi bacterium]|nr:hypothetical protein [Chloroflexota bacterium]